jgi:hypothetical protein
MGHKMTNWDILSPQGSHEYPAKLNRYSIKSGECV